jgi:hypothetical protein
MMAPRVHDRWIRYSSRRLPAAFSGHSYPSCPLISVPNGSLLEVKIPVALFLVTTAYIPVQRAAMVADRVGLAPSSRRLFGAVL